jgi:hypothetical protein
MVEIYIKTLLLADLPLCQSLAVLGITLHGSNDGWKYR